MDVSLIGTVGKCCRDMGVSPIGKVFENVALAWTLIGTVGKCCRDMGVSPVGKVFENVA